MPVVNELPTMGGGKWELLWTNPNPNSAITSNVNVYLDMTQYERVFVSICPNTSNTSTVSLVESPSGGRWVTVNMPGDTATIAYRWFRWDDTLFLIGRDGGYANQSSAGSRNNSYGIILAVYGVKRLNLG